MTKVNESFSAFLDGEASELDIQRLLKAYEEDPNVAGHWHDLSSAQALLNDEVVSQAGLQFKAPLTSEQPTESLTRWLSRTAVAAGVAIAVTSGYWLTVQTNVSSTIPKISVNQSEQSSAVLAAQQFEAQQRLQTFLKEHIEQASFSSGHGVIPSDLTWSQMSDGNE
jgi:sigma-E factor negative regulatory protein RseA